MLELRTIGFDFDEVSKISTTLAVCIAMGAATALKPGAPLLAEEAHASAALVKPLKAAHDDLIAKKFSEAIARLKETDAASGKSAYDQHLINDMLGYSYAHTHDYAGAAKEWEAVVDDGFTAQTDRNMRVRALAELNYQLKNYDKVITYGLRAIKGGYGDETMLTAVGQAYYLKGDWKSTHEFEDQLAAAEHDQDGRPKKAVLQLLYSACAKLQDRECWTRALERLRRYYPGTDPMAPDVQLGTVHVYFFGPPQEVGGPRGDSRVDDRHSALLKIKACFGNASAANGGDHSSCLPNVSTTLPGISQAEMISVLGPPTWCQAADRVVTHNRDACSSNEVAGWSFPAEHPVNQVGGGVELVCDPGDNLTCGRVYWVANQ